MKLNYPALVDDLSEEIAQHLDLDFGDFETEIRSLAYHILNNREQAVRLALQTAAVAFAEIANAGDQEELTEGLEYAAAVLWNESVAELHVTDKKDFTVADFEADPFDAEEADVVPGAPAPYDHVAEALRCDEQLEFEGELLICDRAKHIDGWWHCSIDADSERVLAMWRGSELMIDAEVFDYDDEEDEDDE